MIAAWCVVRSCSPGRATRACSRAPRTGGTRASRRAGPQSDHAAIRGGIDALPAESSACARPSASTSASRSSSSSTSDRVRTSIAEDPTGGCRARRRAQLRRRLRRRPRVDEDRRDEQHRHRDGALAEHAARQPREQRAALAGREPRRREEVVRRAPEQRERDERRASRAARARSRSSRDRARAAAAGSTRYVPAVSSTATSTVASREKRRNAVRRSSGAPGHTTASSCTSPPTQSVAAVRCT